MKPPQDAALFGNKPTLTQILMTGEARLERFQKKIRGRLKAWKEEEHRADRALRELPSKSEKRDRTDES